MEAPTIVRFMFITCSISCSLANVPPVLQVQPVFFNGVPYFGAPSEIPKGFATSPLFNLFKEYEVPSNVTVNLPGLSPFMIYNSYGYYMPPVGVESAVRAEVVFMEYFNCRLSSYSIMKAAARQGRLLQRQLPSQFPRPPPLKH